VQVRFQEGVADVAAQKQRLETQLANERIMFEFGDLSKEEYIERRGELIRRRDGLRETDEWEAVLARAAAFLNDLPAAWRAADGAQRNALARMLFAQIRIKDDWVAAVEPQPSFAPFFTGTVKCDVYQAEATGIGLAHTSCSGWHRRHRLGTRTSSPWHIQARRLSTAPSA
jgi:hypothetical protein